MMIGNPSISSSNWIEISELPGLGQKPEPYTEEPLLCPETVSGHKEDKVQFNRESDRKVDEGRTFLDFGRRRSRERDSSGFAGNRPNSSTKILANRFDSDSLTHKKMNPPTTMALLSPNHHHGQGQIIFISYGPMGAMIGNNPSQAADMLGGSLGSLGSISPPVVAVPPPVGPLVAQQQLVAPVGALYNVDTMEMLWHNHFESLFQSFWLHHNHAWNLIPKALIDWSTDDWNVHTDAAKVRFLCEICNNGWTSMKGRVVFWYTLDRRSLRGTVAFALFGQKCHVCAREGFDNFTSSMWYQEEVAKVICNVYNSVGQAYYGFQQPPYLRIRRAGKPRSQHVSELCQACQMGVCSAMGGGGTKKEMMAITYEEVSITNTTTSITDKNEGGDPPPPNAQTIVQNQNAKNTSEQKTA